MIERRVDTRFTLTAKVVMAGLFGLVAACGTNRGRYRPMASFAVASDDDTAWVEGKTDSLFPRDRYFVGVGSCGPEIRESERMDCAIQRALGQAVGMVRQHVRVEVRRHTEVNRHVGQGGSEVRIRSTYQNEGIGQAELSVDDVAPRRRTCSSDGQCHALVALERRVLAARSFKKIGHMQAQVGELLDRAEKSDTIAAIEQLSMASRILASIDREAELLAAVAGPNAVPPSAWSRLSAVRNKRLESVAVCLSSSLADPPAQLVFALAHQHLSTRGFSRVAIAKAPDCPADSISVTFDGATLERVAEYQLWVYEVRGTVVLRAGAHSLGKGTPVLGRGVARLREQARSQAEQDLAENVQQSLARLLDPTEGSAP